MSTTSIETLVLTWFAKGSDAAARKRAEQLLAGTASTRLARQYATRGLALFRKPALFTEELLKLAEVDLNHARQVADLALTLFDACAPALGLSPRQRQLLEHMALLHNLGVNIDEPRHHLAGRDALQAVRLLGVTPVEQRVIACGVRFHRKAVRPREEPLFVGLPVRWQTPTLLLSGLLRIADGLDYSTTQTTRISACAHDDDRLHLTVLGLHAVEDARRALTKADLWQTIAHEKVEIHVNPDLEAFAATIVTPQSPLLSAFQLGLADQLRRWRASAPGAQADDQRDLKALRAAARRSNAALWVFGACFRARPTKALRQRLKLAEKTLGAVRDWDLALDEAEEAFEGQDNGLLKDWRRERRKAHKRATAWFKSDMDTLRAELERLLVEPPLRSEAGAPIGDHGQALLQTPLKRLRRAFARLDRDDALPALHEVRLALKRMRFTVELLVPLYGQPAATLLPIFIRAQDRLGGINDLHVAHNRVLDYLSRYPGEADAFDYARLLAAQIKKQLGRVDADLQPLRPDVIAVEFGRWGTGRAQSVDAAPTEDDGEVA
ncbi:MAG: CHAD domain-containing protein [Anaerolineales bacterium]|nr:CHAD domain-containing protein [Anaerolineales bacterium]